MTNFNLYEKNILSVLYSAEKPLVTEKIARLTGVSQITARKYLNSLQERNVLNSKKINKKNYWWIIVN